MGTQTHLHHKVGCLPAIPTLWATGLMQATFAPHGELLVLSQAGLVMTWGDNWKCLTSVTAPPAPMLLPQPHYGLSCLPYTSSQTDAYIVSKAAL